MDHKILMNPMPKCCTECPLYVNKFWGDFQDYCSLTHEDTCSRKYLKIRHEKCPLSSTKDASEEIRALAKSHSIEIPIVYGDGTKSTDKVISLSELGIILYEVLENDERYEMNQSNNV